MSVCDVNCKRTRLAGCEGAVRAFQFFSGGGSLVFISQTSPFFFFAVLVKKWSMNCCFRAATLFILAKKQLAGWQWHRIRFLSQELENITKYDVTDCWSDYTMSLLLLAETIIVGLILNCCCCADDT